MSPAAQAQFLPRDSLLRELETRRMQRAVRDSDYVRLLFLLARSYRPNPSQMRPFVDEARSLVGSLNSPRLTARLYLNIGNILRLERRFVEARDTLQLALQGFTEQRDSLNMSSTLGLIAVMYQQRDIFSMALEYYMSEMDIADKCRDEKNSFLARVNLSEIALAMQQPPKALFFARQAEAFLQKNTLPAFTIEWQKAMAAAYRMNQRPDSALLFARRGVENAWKLRDTLLVVNLLAQEVQAERERKNSNAALRLLDSLIFLDTALSSGSNVPRPFISSIAAEVYVYSALHYSQDSPLNTEGSRRQRLEKALYFSAQGLNNVLVSKKEMLELLGTQIQAYYALGNIREAFQSQSRLLRIRDSVFTSSLHASIADMQERYALKEKEAEIAVLQAQDRRWAALNWLLATLALSGIVIAGLLYWRYRSKKHAEDALQEAHGRLQQMYNETVSYKNRIEEQNSALRTQEQALLQSLKHKEFLAIVADNTAQMVIITDVFGKVQFVNTKFEQYTGYTQEEILGQKPGAILQGNNTNPHTIKEIAIALRERKSFEGNILNYTKEGREYWVHLSITPVFNAAGECEHFVAMQYDVTNQLREQAEERLQAELTLQSMMDSTREIMMLVGADFRVMQFNKTAYWAMRAMIPHVEPEIGMDMRQYSPIPLEEVERDFAQVMRGKSVVFDMDIPNPSQPSEILTFEVHYNPVRNLQSEIIGVSFVARNITKRRQAQLQMQQINSLLEERVHERTAELEVRAIQLSSANNKLAAAFSELEMAQLELWTKNQELESLNKKLEEASREKSEILGIVAHDLKSPLSGIQGLAELMATGIDEGSARQAANEIYRAAERMFLLITNLLNVNAIETGKMAINPVPLDICFVTEHIIEEYTLRAAAKEIVLLLDTPERPLYVIADEFGLPQAIENLVSNAVKYSPPNSTVRIRLREGVTAEKVTMIRLEIQDEGPGISEKDKEKLFGKFSRLSAKPTGGEHSTGLGLNITKKIIEIMNGKIWCESVLGQGATFVVELPVAKE